MITEWLSSVEIKSTIGDPPPTRLTRLAGLRRVLNGGLMPDPVARLNAALEGRYAIERRFLPTARRPG